MFQSLRQFGDPFAVCAVTILAALQAHNLHDTLRIGLLTLVISYFMVKTGSFLTAVILRIIHEIYMFSLFQIESYGGIFSLQWWIIVLFPCAIGLLSLAALFLRKGDAPAAKHENPVYMTFLDKATAFFTCLPMVIEVITCILLIVITSVLG